MTSTRDILGRALQNMTISTMKSCIVLIEACESREEAIRELKRWLADEEKLKS